MGTAVASMDDTPWKLTRLCGPVPAVFPVAKSLETIEKNFDGLGGHPARHVPEVVRKPEQAERSWFPGRDSRFFAQFLRLIAQSVAGQPAHGGAMSAGMTGYDAFLDGDRAWRPLDASGI
jgi:hypothetical protein